jgi:hypothetical protein
MDDMVSSRCCWWGSRAAVVFAHLGGPLELQEKLLVICILLAQVF